MSITDKVDHNTRNEIAEDLGWRPSKESLSLSDNELKHNTPLAYPFYCMYKDTKKDRPDLKIHDGLVDYRRPTAHPRAGMDTSHAYATALMVPRSPPNRQRRRLTTRQSNTQGRL